MPRKVRVQQANGETVVMEWRDFKRQTDDDARDLEEKYRPEGFDAEAQRQHMHRTMLVCNVVKSIRECSSPESLAEEMPSHLAYRLERLDDAIAWLNRFKAAWDARHAKDQ